MTFDITKATVIEAAEYLSTDYTNGNVCWIEKMAFDGKKYAVTYEFSLGEIEDSLAEDYPWDGDHIVNIEEIEE